MTSTQDCFWGNRCQGNWGNGGRLGECQSHRWMNAQRCSLLLPRGLWCVIVCGWVGDCVIACNYALSGSLGGLLLNLHLLTNELPGSQAKGFKAGSVQIPFKTITKTTRLTFNVDLEGFQECVKDESVIHKRHIASDLMQLIRGWHMFPSFMRCKGLSA